jgi:hypothetical protein
MRRVALTSAAAVLLLGLIGVVSIAAAPQAVSRLRLTDQVNSATTSAVPSPSDFSWKPVSCSAPGNVHLNVHDSYPGPLEIVYTLTVEPRANSQPVFGTLHPGNNTVVGPSVANRLILTIQVKNGEGAVAILTLDHSAWAALCARPAAPITGTGG